jgi:hypothetical protein
MGGLEMKRLSLPDGILGIVAIITLINVWHALTSGAGADPIAIAPGIVEFRVGSELSKLRDFRSGSCRYVIVADPDCPACRTHAKIWGADLRARRAHLPRRDWAVLWLVTDGRDAIERLELEDAPYPVFPLADDELALQQAGVRAFPWSIVLDRSGRVLDSGPGARLPTADSFRPDCTLAPPAGLALEAMQ